MSRKRKPEDGETFLLGAEAFGTWAENGDVEELVPFDEEFISGDVELPVKKPMPDEIKHFLQMFATLRTTRTHIDPERRTWQKVSNEQIATESTEWIKSNPKLTKDDLACMKEVLGRLDVPKQNRHDLLQDMRGKTFYDLCMMFNTSDDLLSAAVKLFQMRRR